MKQIRKINQQQTELFFELDPSSSPIRVELPLHQETELKKAIAELLLGIARKKQRQTGGGDDA
jgi:hypothetical protein